MDLRARLRAMNGNKLLAAPPVIRRQASSEHILGGLEVTTGQGSCFVVEQRYPLSHHHGAPIGAFANHPAGHVATLTGDARLASFDPRRAVILDTETTGLAGGTGTYTFLVGVGTIEADEFVIRQFFLRELIEERALLTALAERLTDRGGLITYNGRCFDWPLLATRFTLARLRGRLPDLPHWDVLPLARRLWRGRVGACNLGALETTLLAQPRHDDTPGWLIPQLYFDYLRDGDARRLTGVFDHNRRDILALAALTGRVCQMLADPFSAAITHGQDFAALARHADTCGRTARAITLYQHALTLDLAGGERETAQRHLSLLLKRERRWPEAVTLWRAMLAESPDAPFFPALELAKYYEHVQRDYHQAALLVEPLLVTCDLRGLESERTDLLHRLTRLQNRMGGHR